VSGVVSMDLAAIGARIRSQDNLATAGPIFVVQQKRRLYGLDPAYTETFVWMNSDGEEADENERATRVGYLDQWEFVTACFTQGAAQRFIDENAHNLKEPRIFVESSYRNYEWQAVREYLKAVLEC